MDSGKVFLGLAEGMGKRHPWVPAHGHRAGPCSLPVPSGCGWRRFWGKYPEREIFNLCEASTGASSSSAVTGYNSVWGPKKLKHQMKVPARAGGGSGLRGKYMLWPWCVWVHTSEQGPRGGESIPAPGPPLTQYVPGDILLLQYFPSSRQPPTRISGVSAGALQPPHPPFSPRSPAAVTMSSSAGRSRGAP